jgi:hypothetical protein
MADWSLHSSHFPACADVGSCDELSADECEASDAEGSVGHCELYSEIREVHFCLVGGQHFG